VHKREGGNISQIPPADVVERNSNQYKILESITNNGTQIDLASNQDLQN